MAAERLIKPWKPGPQQTYVFRNANVIDPVSGSILSQRTVKISGGVIQSVTSTEEEYVIVPTGKELVVDLKGNYLCPGLIDNRKSIGE
jgi:adenine deaminase